MQWPLFDRGKGLAAAATLPRALREEEGDGREREAGDDSVVPPTRCCLIRHASRAARLSLFFLRLFWGVGGGGSQRDHFVNLKEC